MLPSAEPRARITLENLRTGDAFGERFFFPGRWLDPNHASDLPPAPWPWTDDTAMAIEIFEELREHGDVDETRLAGRFARRYRAEPHRGYGASAHEVLTGIAGGGNWQVLARGVFGGTGSMGNGSAMRVAPLGAWMADREVGVLVDAALVSARPTHMHPEGGAGAVAVALATAAIWRGTTGDELLEHVIRFTPAGPVADGIVRVRELGGDAMPRAVVDAVGNGSRITCRDTVPYCAWVAAYHGHDFASAMRLTVAAGGDMDTTCAIVAGMIAGTSTAPDEWTRRSEGLPV